MYNFDEKINRKGTNSIKWDSLKAKYGRGDLIPLWVADMDLKCGEFINKAVEEKLKDRIFGYNYIPDSYYEAIINWNKKRNNFYIEKEWILFAPTVIQGIYYSLKALTNEGDEVIIQTPVYHRFFDIVRNADCKLVENPLVFKNNKYYMDFEDFENKITDKTKALILCSPHNPVGRVWSKEELEKLCDICLKHNIIIISDEIHSDLIFKKNKHTVLSNVNDKIKDKCIITSAPTKTFNLAGFQVSNLIIYNEKIRQRVKKELEKNFIGKPNAFATCVLEAAYNKGEQYVKELVYYIEDNKKFVIEFLKKNIPDIDVIDSEGTYVLWMNFSKINSNEKELEKFIIEKCNLVLNSGSTFGRQSEGFMRMNIACSRELLLQALENIYKAYKNIK